MRRLTDCSPSGSIWAARTAVKQRMKSMSYAFTHEGKTFIPSGQANISNVDDHNKAIEARELAEWATKPDYACVYVKGDKIITWLGTVMGTITRKNTYQNNFGSRTTSISVTGTNGAKYHGRYGSDWSEFCKLHKSKV